jgi:hypothetical protein
MVDSAALLSGLKELHHVNPHCAKPNSEYRPGLSKKTQSGPVGGNYFLRKAPDALTRQKVTMRHSVLFSLLPGTVVYVHASPRHRT